MDDKQWFLAAGGKTVGPMTAERVRERITTGKVTPKTKAFREGMEAWLLLSDVPEFANGANGATAAPAPAAEEAAPAAEAPEVPVAPVAPAAAAEAPKPVATPAPAARRPARTSTSSGPTPAVAGAGAPPAAGVAARLTGLLGAGPLPLRFDAPHRIERRDIWLAFRIGFDRPRVLVALLTFGGAAVVSFVLAIMGALAGNVSGILALPMLLAAAVAGPAIVLVGTGALAYQTRRRLAEGTTPPVKEALLFAKQNALALASVPFGVTFAVLLPVIALVVLSLFMRIPYAGPVFTGLIYGLHIALGAATLFLVVAAALSWTLCPIIVGFEESSPRETARILFDFVRRSAVRFAAWALLPGFGLLGLSAALAIVGALILVIPLTINGAIGGGMGGIGDILTLLGGGGGFGGGRHRFDDEVGDLRSYGGGARSSPPPARPAAPAPRETEPAPAPAVSADDSGAIDAEIADVITQPSRYDGKLVRSRVWWKGWSDDGAKVSALGALNDVELSIHELTPKLHGRFLEGIGHTEATVLYRVHEQGDYIGALVGVQPDGASAMRQVTPTDEQLKAEEVRVAKEKAEGEAREKERAANAAKVRADVEAALAAKDGAKLAALKESKEWRALEHKEEMELSSKIFKARRDIAGESLVAEVKDLIAKDDYFGAEQKTKFLDEDKLGREAADQARKLVRAKRDALSKEAAAEPVRKVKLDDGTEISLEVKELATYMIVKSVTFAGRDAATESVKKPFALTVEYRWIHAGVEEMLVEGSMALVTKKAHIGKDSSSVKLVFDQSRMSSGKASLTARGS